MVDSIKVRAVFVLLTWALSGCGSGGSEGPGTEVATEEVVTDLSVGTEGGESICSAWADPAALPALHVDGLHIRDEFGRTVLLRGVNAGNQAKKPPHLPWEGAAYGEPGFEEELGAFYDFPQAWGHNVIRLTVFWEAIEPERGVYSEAYVAQTRSQVAAATSRGMYVFIDFHQDIYSRILGGSGAPAWALPDPETPSVPLDDPGWFMKVLNGEEALAAFDHFWANEDGVQDAYREMAVWFSEQLADMPGVIGIDLMNEPTPGTEGKKAPQAWLEERLKPFYESVGMAIHERVPRYLLFVESTSLEAAGETLGEGLPRPDLEQMVFSPHYYNTIQFLTGIYDGKIEYIREGLTKWAHAGEELGVPVLLSEYGFRGYSEAGNPELYLVDHYRVMDELLMHGTLWSHEITSHYWNLEDCAIVGGDWQERPDMADPLARPYPRYTSGTGIAFDYDPVTHGLVYTYSTAETAGAPTVIALPRRHYPVEPQVSVSFGDWEYRAQQAELWVFDRLCERAADAGEQQVVSVSP